MNAGLTEIKTGVQRTLHLIDRPEKKALFLASGIMLVAGVLTNLPAVILGKLVDKLTVTSSFELSSVTGFIVLIIVIIVVREALTVWRKYLVENVKTQTEKKQTVDTIAHILKADSSSLDTLGVFTCVGLVKRKGSKFV